MVNYIAAGGIFLITFIAILRERVDRTIVAMTGAAAMLVAGLGLGFYSQDNALDSIDFNTLGLLLGMMVIVEMLSHTGFFQYLAIVTAKKSGGNPWRLLLILGGITVLLSMFLDNVTTIVLIAPISILIAEILGISPALFLISLALLANSGGVATLVGDPPNILIGSAANLSFNDFLIRLTPIVLVCLAVIVYLFKFVFKQELAKKPRNIRALSQLDESEALHDKQALVRILSVLIGVIILFFLHSWLHLAPATIALIGAACALLIVQPDVEKIFKELEWGVLLFFAALFVLVGGLQSSGLLTLIASNISSLAQTNLLLAGIILIWGSALLSAIIDNIPFTIVMIPIIQSLGGQGIDIVPLWWALALGAGFGANATPIGSTANVIAVKLSQRTRQPISTQRWLRAGIPVTIAACLVASLLYALTFRFM